jgi:hypothetical protein
VAAESLMSPADTDCWRTRCFCSTTRRRMALVLDPNVPASALVLYDALLTVWPRLAGRVAFSTVGIDDVELVLATSHVFWLTVGLPFRA